jgi:hypothetical protein
MQKISNAGCKNSLTNQTRKLIRSGEYSYDQNAAFLLTERMLLPFRFRIQLFVQKPTNFVEYQAQVSRNSMSNIVAVLSPCGSHVKGTTLFFFRESLASHLSLSTFQVRLVLSRVTAYMPAMHKCLETPDLLEMICKVLKDDFGNHALSSLARTCRAFHEPALDILWNTLSSLVPLLKTFPPCLWNVAQVANGRTLFVRSTLSICPNLPLRRMTVSVFSSTS